VKKVQLVWLSIHFVNIITLTCTVIALNYAQVAYYAVYNIKIVIVSSPAPTMHVQCMLASIQPYDLEECWGNSRHPDDLQWKLSTLFVN